LTQPNETRLGCETTYTPLDLYEVVSWFAVQTHIYPRVKGVVDFSTGCSLAVESAASDVYDALFSSVPMTVDAID
jgi:hypothetical protein